MGEIFTSEYDPYGEILASSGTNPGPFAFTGEWTDQNGLVHLRARYYDPVLGAFFNQDFLETDNRYSYVDGNPIDYTDPSGLCLLGKLPDGRCRGHGVTDAISDTFTTDNIVLAINLEAEGLHHLGIMDRETTRGAVKWSLNQGISAIDFVQEHPTEFAVAEAVGLTILGLYFSPVVAIGVGTNLLGSALSGNYDVNSPEQMYPRMMTDAVIGGLSAAALAGTPGLKYATNLGGAVVFRASWAGIVNMGQGLVTDAAYCHLFGESGSCNISVENSGVDLGLGFITSGVFDTLALGIASQYAPYVRSSPRDIAVIGGAATELEYVSLGSTADKLLTSRGFQAAGIAASTNITGPVVKPWFLRHSNTQDPPNLPDPASYGVCTQ